MNLNLNLARKLLIAAEQQRHGFLQVRGREIAHEVELLAAAGLVEAVSGKDGSDASAVIKCVTEAGRRFIRAYKGQSVADVNRQMHPPEDDFTAPRFG